MKVETVEAYKCTCEGCGETVVLAECPSKLPRHFSRSLEKAVETEESCIEGGKTRRRVRAKRLNEGILAVRAIWEKCASSALWAVAIQEFSAWRRDQWKRHQLLWLLGVLVREGSDYTVESYAYTLSPEEKNALSDHFIERCIRKIGHSETSWPYVEIPPETPLEEARKLAHNAWMSPEVVQ